MHVASIRLDFHYQVRVDLLSLVVWSRVFWPSVTWNLRKAQRWTFELRNLWLLLVLINKTEEILKMKWILIQYI